MDFDDFMELFRQKKDSLRFSTLAKLYDLLKQEGNGVVGFSAVVQKRVKGGRERQGTVARVYVEAKKRKEELDLRHLIPSKISGMRTDIIEVGKLEAVGPSVPDIRHGRINLLMGGISIGHKDITAGTLGRPVMMNDKPYLLSNNHVFANVSKENDVRAAVGDAIYQPGVFDIENSIEDVVSDFYLGASLYEWVPYKTEGNLVDAALATPLREWSRAQLGLTFTDLKDIKIVQVGDTVVKSGRTTGVTTMQVIDTSAVVNVQMGDDLISFSDQLILQTANKKAGSAGGDSGALILHIDSNDVGWNVGLLFAGSIIVTIANKMQNVVDAFSSPLILDIPFSGTPVPEEPTTNVKYHPVTKEITVTVVDNTPVDEWRDAELVIARFGPTDPPVEINIGESINIAGTLKDVKTGLGIPDKKVQVEGVELTTDTNGIFGISVGPIGAEGPAVVTVSFAGDSV